MTEPTTTTASTEARIPHRPYGDGQQLAATAAVVGLGCSSFSGLFLDDAGADDPSWLTDTDTTDVATIDPQHALVREWVTTIRYAVCQAGVTLLDTAPWYGHGLSEQVVGLALRELFADGDGDNWKRSDIILNTKVGRYEADPAAQFDFSRDATLASVDRSLRRLQTSYIDVLQLHDPEFSPSLELLLRETVPALLACRRGGKCRALGLTGYPLAVQRQILQATLDRFPQEDTRVWDQALTYGHYNLHDMTLLRQPHGLSTTTTTADAPSYYEFCRARRCICLAAAPLSMGLLTPTASPPAWHPASEALREACRETAALCAALGVDLAELALLVALSEPKIPVTIVGMKDVEQVQTVQRTCQRLQAADFDLNLALRAEEHAVWKQLQDTERGPFAEVWKTGDYHWDGVAQVKEFWRSVPDSAAKPLVEEWQASSV